MRCYVFFRFVIVLTVIILAVCVFSIASADQISSVFSKSIPIIDLNTGVTNNQSFTAAITWMAFTPSSTIMPIDGSVYRVYTSATYNTTDFSHGVIGTFAAVNNADISTYYNSAAYSLKVTALSYHVDYACYARGSKDANGSYSFGGSTTGSGYGGGSRWYYKQLIQLRSPAE